MNHFDRSSVSLIFIVILSFLLRIIWLDQIPPSLYTDEINQGYNAYSILLTGKDEHGVFLPASLRSFGDWKPPLPTYLMIPFVAALGLNEIAVRLPGALLGVGTVILTFYLVKKLFKEEKNSVKIALTVSFFVAISPWHILQSRSAMLVGTGLFFLEAGIFCFIASYEYPKLLLLSALSFSLSLYAYYGLRVVTPLIVLFLILYSRHLVRIRTREILFSVMLGLIVLLPLSISFFGNPDVIFGRARTVSIFFDQGVKLRQWELIVQDGINSNTLITRFFHNNLNMYGRDVIQRFLSHFDGRYLFLNGDKVSPFQIPNMGILYLIDAIFLVIGFTALFTNKSRHRNFILLWLLISFIPASFSFMTPSSNRTFNALIPLMILIAVGVNRMLLLRGKLLFALLFSILYLFNFGYFLHQYFLILPKNHSDWWNYGWKETVKYIGEVEDKYDNIVVFDRGGMPYINFLFYGKINPLLYQKEVMRPYIEDQFGFEHVEGFGKYLFPNDWEWKYTKDNLQKHTLYVVPSEQAKDDSNFLHAIYYPDGKIKLKIFANE